MSCMATQFTNGCLESVQSISTLNYPSNHLLSREHPPIVEWKSDMTELTGADDFIAGLLVTMNSNDLANVVGYINDN